MLGEQRAVETAHRHQGSVDVGGSTVGSIDWGSDRDWFKVTLEAGKTYRFDLEGSSTSQGTLRDPYLAGTYRSGVRQVPYTTPGGAVAYRPVV